MADSTSTEAEKLIAPCINNYTFNHGHSKTWQGDYANDIDEHPLFPPRVSGTELRAKEVILICLALLLLLCSILLFFKHWKKNYRDINQLPYYAYLYQKETEAFLNPTALPVPVGVALLPNASPSPAALPLLGTKGSHRSCENFFSLVDRDTFMSNSAANQKRVMARSHSVRAGSGGGQHIRLSHLVTAAQHKSKTFSRTGTETALLAFGRGSSGNLRGVSKTCASMPTSFSMASRRRLPPQRAASDVFGRFNNCKLDVMRRMQSGLELEEEGEGGTNASSQLAGSTSYGSLSGFHARNSGHDAPGRTLREDEFQEPHRLSSADETGGRVHSRGIKMAPLPSSIIQMKDEDSLSRNSLTSGERWQQHQLPQATWVHRAKISTLELVASSSGGKDQGIILSQVEGGGGGCRATAV